MQAIDKSGYSNEIKIGLDVAASEFWDEKNQIYDLSFKWTEGKKKHLTTDQMISLYQNLV